MRLPPCRLSVRRIVVPIGSDGVMPQRCAIDAARQLWRHASTQEDVYQSALREPKNFQMSVGRKGHFRRSRLALGQLFPPHPADTFEADHGAMLVDIHMWRKAGNKPANIPRRRWGGVVPAVRPWKDPQNPAPMMTIIHIYQYIRGRTSSQRQGSPAHAVTP